MDNEDVISLSGGLSGKPPLIPALTVNVLFNFCLSWHSFLQNQIFIKFPSSHVFKFHTLKQYPHLILKEIHELCPWSINSISICQLFSLEQVAYSFQVFQLLSLIWESTTLTNIAAGISYFKISILLTIWHMS